MASPLFFNYATITTAGNSWRPWAHALREEGMAKLAEHGGIHYGLWSPLFGLASNQIIMMTSWPEPNGVMPRVAKALMGIVGIVEVDQHMVVSTTRPTTSAPPHRAGLYVHRWFYLEPQHVEEAVQLSDTAWGDFENAFDVEVIGFFQTLEPQATLAELMLLNWYPNLAAWEQSRRLDLVPASRQRFARRFHLSQRMRAMATSLESEAAYLAARIS